MGTHWVNAVAEGRGGAGKDDGFRSGDDDGVTVKQAFDELLADIEITEAEREEASRQQQSVRRKLDSRLRLAATFLSGSYRRNTKPRPCDDIDLLVVLDHEFYGDDECDEKIELTADGAKAGIDLVFNALRDAYPHTELRRFDRGVQIKFSGSGIGFDVVPAFQFTDDEFWIPDRKRRTWIRTNPKEQQRLVSESNQERCDGMLVPLVKLLKTWNDARGKRGILRGFHLEAMAFHALQSAPISFPKGVEQLLSDASTRVLSSVPDIWPFGEEVTTDLSSDDRAAASAQLLNAADEAQRAIDADEDNRPEDAHQIWYDVFGSRYPGNGPSDSEKSLSGSDSLHRLRTGAKVSATSAGLVAPRLGYGSTSSSTSHGGATDELPHELRHDTAHQESPQVEDNGHLERQIASAQRQFQALKRLTPTEAAADADCWPVTDANADGLYAVLVGEQRTNTGRKHRILVTVPRDMPGREPRVYVLAEKPRLRSVHRGWRNVRGRRHRWSDGALCTHAMRDRWDGRLSTALVYAVDYLVRQDYYELTRVWVGREIRPNGSFKPASPAARSREAQR